jgi:hypothetical protein
MAFYVSGNKSGGWQLLDTSSITSASVAPTFGSSAIFTSDYDQYKIVVTGLTTGQSGQNNYFKMKINDSLKSADYSYATTEYKSDVASGAGALEDVCSNSASKIRITAGNNPPPGHFTSLQMYTHSPTSTTEYKSIYFEGAGHQTAGVRMGWGLGAYRGNYNEPLTGITFVRENDGDFQAGKFQIYGLLN